MADKIYSDGTLNAPRVAKSCEPGQFVIVKMDEVGERIPLTICDYDREAGTVTIVFQVVGASHRAYVRTEGRRFISRISLDRWDAHPNLLQEDLEECKEEENVCLWQAVLAPLRYIHR